MHHRIARARLEAIIGGFAGRRIVVAGDFVLDRFVHGLPKRISREAPVLILRYAGEQAILGGGANTAANVASLGGAAIPVGAVGADAAGRRLRELFAEAGIPDGGVAEVSDYATPTKTRILGGGLHSIKQQVVRIDREDHLPDSPETNARIEESLIGASESADALVLSDYGYGSCRPEWVARTRARRPELPILVDARYGLFRYAGATAATPNEEELEQWSGRPVGDSDEELAEAARALRAELGANSLLVTRGSRGMALFDASGDATWIPVHGTDQVADVTGAGDTVLATFALSLAAGANPLEGALLANFAGGVVVMKAGTATVSAVELRESISRDRAILAAP
jgi:rfaE bifunctional protein kinase chain/domain